jgi:hypothetical protein
VLTPNRTSHPRPAAASCSPSPAYWAPDDFPQPGPMGASEMAGPRWSPDGSRLFISVQYPGVTCVIEGPWHKLH